MDFSADLILICHSLDAGGIERVVSTLANEWNRQGRKICVITMHDRRRFFSLDPGIHHIIVDSANVTWLVELLKKLKSQLEKLRIATPWLVAILGAPLYQILYRLNFDIFLGYEAWALRRVLRRVESPIVVSFGTSINVITLKACRGLGRRVIISERNDPERLLKYKLWDYMWRKLYHTADVVTANTQSGLDSMADFVPRKKLAFVPNPLAAVNGNGTHADDHPSVHPFVLTVGRLVWDKAHDVLLDAFARLDGELNGWRLSIVGDGERQPDLEIQAERLGIARRIDWHGVVPDPHRFYRAASVFVMPSRVEGQPNALLEAMSCGLPVIVSNGAPGLLELVEDGKTGLVVPVNNPEALADALRRLTHNGELRKRMGAAARERVAEYDLPKALAAWESVIGLRSSQM